MKKTIVKIALSFLPVMASAEVVPSQDVVAGGASEKPSVIVNCEGEVRDAINKCRYTKIRCDYLEECLIRRDTCFEKKSSEFNFQPENKEVCENMNNCMDSLRVGYFKSDSISCEYSWIENMKSDQKCHVSSEAWYVSDDGCPGDLDGWEFIMSSAEAVADRAFTCRGAKLRWEGTKDGCIEHLNEIEASCSAAQLEAAYQGIGLDTDPSYCEFQHKFDLYLPGQFKVIPEPTAEQIDGSGRAPEGSGVLPDGRPAREGSGTEAGG